MKHEYLFCSNVHSLYKGFCLTVFASSILRARQHIKRQTISCKYYRDLDYIGCDCADADWRSRALAAVAD